MLELNQPQTLWEFIPSPVLPCSALGSSSQAVLGAQGAGQPRAVVPAAGTRSVTLEMRENKPGNPTELLSRFPFIPQQKTHKTHFKKSSVPPPSRQSPSVQSEPFWGGSRGIRAQPSSSSCPQPPDQALPKQSPGTRDTKGNCPPTMQREGGSPAGPASPLIYGLQ